MAGKVAENDNHPAVEMSVILLLNSGLTWLSVQLLEFLLFSNMLDAIPMPIWYRWGLIMAVVLGCAAAWYVSVKVFFYSEPEDEIKFVWNTTR